MNKFALIVAVSAVVVGTSAAQSIVAKRDRKVSCAVMPNDKVDVAKATANKMFADYKGRRFYFCCEGCPDAFKKNPEKYAKTAESTAIPKAPKKAKSEKKV